MASPSADDTAEASVTETTKIRQGEHTCWRCRFFNDACRSHHQDLHMVFDGKALMLSGERRAFSRYKSIEHGEILERHCKVINDLSSTSPTNNRELSYSHLFRRRASLDHRPSALFSNVFASSLVVLVRRHSRRRVRLTVFSCCHLAPATHKGFTNVWRRNAPNKLHPPRKSSSFITKAKVFSAKMPNSKRLRRSQT